METSEQGHTDAVRGTVALLVLIYMAARIDWSGSVSVPLLVAVLVAGLAGIAASLLLNLTVIAQRHFARGYREGRGGN